MKEWITIDQICEKQFSEVHDGYSKEAVDDFLDAICEEIDHLQQYSIYLEDKKTILTVKKLRLLQFQ